MKVDTSIIETGVHSRGVSSTQDNMLFLRRCDAKSDSFPVQLNGNAMNLSEALNRFDIEFKGKSALPRSLVSVDGQFTENVALFNDSGLPLEEYYKWQLIYGLINSGLYSKDLIGTEVYFPKGNISSAPIKIDAVLFSDITWIDHYRTYRQTRDQDALHAVRRMAIGVIEFKREGRKIEQVFSSQIRASMREPEAPFVLGAYYDTRRLYLFQRKGDEIARLDTTKNFPSSQRVLERLQLEITDPYYEFPSHEALLKLNVGDGASPSVKKIEDLDVILTVHDERIKGALNQILRSLDRVSMVDEEGYLILIQLIALKIFDEKQSEMHGSPLQFYVTSPEHSYVKLSDAAAKSFIERMSTLYDDAKKFYKAILGQNHISWKLEAHTRAAIEIVKELQSFAFTRSRKSDLYQLVFYNFATAFKKDNNSQFLTPLPIINFLVDIVNPRRNETVLDPCCGTSDFLSVSYVSANSKLDDRNLFGTDNDRKMVLLSELNMLLNGDGNANIKHTPNLGALTQKFSTKGEIVTLDEGQHSNGNWDDWADDTELMKFDVVLTNPPFGKGRNLDLNKAAELSAARLYSIYPLFLGSASSKDGLDLGALFLENAVRSLKPGGRFGIVLSNSIASTKTWRFLREWLLDQVRVVGLFDLPQDVFAETGVNTTLIVGYKPKNRSVSELIGSKYEVFTREIHAVGYNKRTSNRNIVFDKIYKLDPVTFETVIDLDGVSVLDEDFSLTVTEFRQWCVGQETELKKLFLD
ncbi:N-6 DNA methylase [Rhizobium pusense]|uniref:HsdM family class I SAM-dependent methyltransferase n=1 Tax=Agrobacterium pusense TaxID=648995 RepID=UPI002446896B|nr:N-6 DNA methylase [Agrobacterium pusense]MDH0115644.1 N-6 DNA methylase [Agrobacterium pusense]